MMAEASHVALLPFWSLMKYVWCCMVALMLLSATPARADGDEDVYQKPQDFVREAFSGSPPPASTLPVGKTLQPDIDAIMEHSYPLAGVTYWVKGGRSVWILEEIGKYKPITVGVVVEGGAIAQVKVLVYRESHGWQVRRDVFTDQFRGATLTEGHGLSTTIDGISGATMSVDALRNLGKLALYLSQHVDRTR